MMSVIRIVHTAGPWQGPWHASAVIGKGCSTGDALCQRCRPPIGSDRNTENVECCSGQANCA